MAREGSRVSLLFSAALNLAPFPALRLRQDRNPCRLPKSWNVRYMFYVPFPSSGRGQHLGFALSCATLSQGEEL